MIIDWIDFGQVSAERDSNLSSYFYDNGVLNSVIKNRHQFLILGRKGAGKTAVFQHFSENPNNYIGPCDVATSLSLQNYSWNVHSLLATDGKAPSLAYIQSWKYIIYLLALRRLIEVGFDSPKLRYAKRIIEKIYTSPTPSFGQLIGQKILQLSRLKLPSGSLDLDDSSLDKISAEGGEISFNDVQNDTSLQGALNRSIERLSEIFEDALLEALSADRRIFVTFDRIDEAWDSSSFESSKKIIAGLIGAAEYIGGKLNGALRPIIFLREDIFETLELNDKNKLRSDCGTLLAWSKDGLSRMILERVNFFARQSKKNEVSNINELFDRSQMRQQRAPFDYIMLRTMLRPRDFIRLFQLVKQDMQERRDNPFEHEEVNGERLECRSIYNAEPAYSEWLVEELRDEWRAQYPLINDLLSAIQNNGRTNLTSDDLEKALQKIDVPTGQNEINSYLRA